MVQNSEELWKEILNNQNYELIGGTNPNTGNGFHDGISWRIPFQQQVFKAEGVRKNTFHSFYLRDLGHLINPNFSKKDKFEKGLSIENCSSNYYNTFLKYFVGERYDYMGNLLRRLGEWGNWLSHDGRLIFEIIGWHDNESAQFYAFQLNKLDTNYCKVTKKSIVYNAPYKLEDNKEIFKKVNIPRNKCIIIEFPNELGGYKGFLSKAMEINSLGNKFLSSNNPDANLNHMNKWHKHFNKIVSDWGAHYQRENITEFYQELCALRLTYTVICCTHEIINGLSQLIEYLNDQLNENARVNFNIPIYDKKDFKVLQNKWMSGELSFKEIKDIIGIRI